MDAFSDLQITQGGGLVTRVLTSPQSNSEYKERFGSQELTAAMHFFITHN